jgi:hypothetical protein
MAIAWKKQAEPRLLARPALLMKLLRQLASQPRMHWKATG